MGIKELKDNTLLLPLSARAEVPSARAGRRSGLAHAGSRTPSPNPKATYGTSSPHSRPKLRRVLLGSQLWRQICGGNDRSLLSV